MKKKTFGKNSHNAEKTERGEGPFNLARYCMLRKKGKTFLVQIPGPTGTTWRLKIL